MFLNDTPYISLIDEQEIKRKIGVFDSLDLSLESEERIKGVIYDIFCVEYKGRKGYALNSYLVSILANERLYRVRKDTSFLNNPQVQDFWDNPFAPQNRFNRAGERVLYVSTNIGTALKETEVEQNEVFVLVEYSIDQPLEVSPTEVRNRYGDDNSKNEALTLLNDFIIRLAKIKVGFGEKYLYKTTNALADIINSFPPNEENARDGMYYVSAYTSLMSNLVIKSSSLRKLSIKNIWLAKINESSRIGFGSNIHIENGLVRICEFQRTSIAHLPMLP